jgi:dihydrofolate reductase
MPLKAIAAMTPDRVIGAGGKIPWHAPEDLKFFKRMTLGHIIVMGRRTFESLGRPLPGRENVVISRSGTWDGVTVVRDVADLVEPGDGREMWVIGGAEIYRALLPRCDELWLTLVDRQVDGDVFFPPFESDFGTGEVVETHPGLEMRRYRRESVRISSSVSG